MRLGRFGQACGFGVGDMASVRLLVAFKIPDVDDRLQVFRVVRCLPLPWYGRGTAKPSGQASYNPRGRKPRNAPARSGQRRSLWGLDARSRVERGSPAGASASTVT